MEWSYALASDMDLYGQQAIVSRKLVEVLKLHVMILYIGGTGFLGTNILLVLGKYLQTQCSSLVFFLYFILTQVVQVSH